MNQAGGAAGGGKTEPVTAIVARGFRPSDSTIVRYQDKRFGLT